MIEIKEINYYDVIEQGLNDSDNIGDKLIQFIKNERGYAHNITYYLNTISNSIEIGDPVLGSAIAKTTTEYYSYLNENTSKDELIELFERERPILKEEIIKSLSDTTIGLISNNQTIIKKLFDDNLVPYYFFDLEIIKNSILDSTDILLPENFFKLTSIQEEDVSDFIIKEVLLQPHVLNKFTFNNIIKNLNKNIMVYSRYIRDQFINKIIELCEDFSQSETYIRYIYFLILLRFDFSDDNAKDILQLFNRIDYSTNLKKVSPHMVKIIKYFDKEGTVDISMNKFRDELFFKDKFNYANDVKYDNLIIDDSLLTDIELNVEYAKNKEFFGTNIKIINFSNKGRNEILEYIKFISEVYQFNDADDSFIDAITNATIIDYNGTFKTELKYYRI